MNQSLAGAMAVGLLLTGAAHAETGNSGAADPDLLIGALHTFTSEAAARQACPGQVVWADRYAGYYYHPNEPEYGNRGQGAFACLADARRANYFDTSPVSGMMQDRGRNFPLAISPYFRFFGS